MRIRKNKKLSASIIWSTAASSSSPVPPRELLQSHVCVVNRSPWDPPPSPPLHHQVIEEDNDIYGMNGSLACDNSMYRSIDSMKRSSDEYKSMTIIPNSIESGSSGNRPPNSLDLVVVSNNDNDKETVVASIEPPKRKPGRPRKVAVAQPPPHSTPTNKAYEIYDTWMRGVGDDDHKAGDRKGKKNRKRISNIVGGGTRCTSSSSHSRKVEETHEELDFIDDDDDSEEDNGGIKRKRKPVKARSLKSLIM